MSRYPNRCLSIAPEPVKAQCKLTKEHAGLHTDGKGVSWDSVKLPQLPHPHDGIGVTERDAQNAVRTLLSYIGEDPSREGLLNTPARVVKAWDEMTSGYGEDPEKILTTDFHGEGYDQMVICRRIQVISTCEHHLLGFRGLAWVAYVPRKRVVGLSKMSRLVQCFMRRLQIQEKLTKQVADAMQQHLNPLGVGVRIVAVHSCMSCRGAMEPDSDMVTTALLGVFRQHKVREEFLMQCK